MSNGLAGSVAILCINLARYYAVREAFASMVLGRFGCILFGCVRCTRV